MTQPQELYPPSQTKYKYCFKCKQAKPEDDFYLNRSSVSGRQSSCIDCNKAYRLSARDLDRTKRYHKNYSLKRFYGITIEEYERLFNEQGGLCASCGLARMTRNGHLHVDHDHETGKVRALLCFCCNTALGHAKDDADLLRKLADYIDKYRHAVPGGRQCVAKAIKKQKSRERHKRIMCQQDLIMERMLGRLLRSDERVEIISGDESDLRDDNLRLVRGVRDNDVLGESRLNSLLAGADDA